jgi:hypothetical protein
VAAVIRVVGPVEYVHRAGCSAGQSWQARQGPGQLWHCTACGVRVSIGRPA